MRVRGESGNNPGRAGEKNTTPFVFHRSQRNAVLLSCHLDDNLSGNAIQHREVQGNESERFLSYFKSRGGVTYRQGGIASGFHRHQANSEPRLLRLKGRHTVRLLEVPAIDWSYISRGDVYLLDLYEVIFIWNGVKSNRYERLQAMQRARQLRDERGKANIVVVEDGEESKMSKDELKLFESRLPLKEKHAKLNASDSLDENDDDKRLDAAHIKLYKCSDESGTLKVTEKKAGPLEKSDLESEVSDTEVFVQLNADMPVVQDAYIIDNGAYGIWVWVGRRSNPKERREAMRNALVSFGRTLTGNEDDVAVLLPSTRTSVSLGAHAIRRCEHLDQSFPR